jgi:hypothetical protein
MPVYTESHTYVSNLGTEFPFPGLGEETSEKSSMMVNCLQCVIEIALSLEGIYIHMDGCIMQSFCLCNMQASMYRVTNMHMYIYMYCMRERELGSLTLERHQTALFVW